MPKILFMPQQVKNSKPKKHEMLQSVKQLKIQKIPGKCIKYWTSLLHRGNENPRQVCDHKHSITLPALTVKSWTICGQRRIPWFFTARQLNACRKVQYRQEDFSDRRIRNLWQVTAEDWWRPKSPQLFQIWSSVHSQWLSAFIKA